MIFPAESTPESVAGKLCRGEVRYLDEPIRLRAIHKTLPAIALNTTRLQLVSADINDIPSTVERVLPKMLLLRWRRTRPNRRGLALRQRIQGERPATQ